jgi:hypothetical protein
MRIEAIRIGDNPPADVNVIVEVPVGGQPIKYEMDKDAGTLVVDRFLHTPMTYPGNYGRTPGRRTATRSTSLSATRGRWSPAASSTFARSAR